jgi:glycosyltransferase involved in cell wall biosynthesis
MRYLFIHQNFPGQYKSSAALLASDPANEVVAISKREQDLIKGVRHLKYKIEPEITPTTLPELKKFEEYIQHGKLAAGIALELKNEGFTPDVIAVHPGWGEAMYLRDVWPDVPQLHYCEYHFHPWRGVNAPAPGKQIKLADAFRTRARNVLGVFSMKEADWGVAPTEWQYSQFPPAFREKMSIIHEGINMGICRPNEDAVFPLPNGKSLSRADEVITYVSRNLEPTRGFPQFMRAAERLCRERPNAQIVIVGGDDTSYSAKLANDKTWREHLLEKVDLDLDRVHFVGKLPYGKYLALLQISATHVYLTTPFVLSWSFLESMSVGCAIVASNTPPVVEVIEDEKNALLVDFDDSDMIADRVHEMLNNPEKAARLRIAARQTIAERYRLKDCMDAQIALLHDVAAGRKPTPGFYRAKISEEVA